jgi:SAM-dependent methyltransferase
MPDFSRATGVADYDRMWDEVYGDLQDFGPAHRHMTRIMKRMLAPLEYSSLLEVGVGLGHNLPLLTEGRQIERLAGIDLSGRALEQVRHGWKGDFHRLDITSERLSETFELVCCALVLEHVHDDLAALHNIRAMCERHLLLATIGGPFERYRSWEQQMGHVRNYAPGELKGKLRQTGFSLVEMVRWGFPFYSPLARTLQNRMTASHELSASARLLARILYGVFFLNSARRGDLLVAVAQPA